MITTGVCSRNCRYFRHSDNFMPPTPMKMAHSLSATDWVILFSWESSIIVNRLFEIWKSYIMHSASKCLLVSVSLSWLLLNCKNNSETFERDSRLFCWNFRWTSKVKCLTWSRPQSSFFLYRSTVLCLSEASHFLVSFYKYCEIVLNSWKDKSETN